MMKYSFKRALKFHFFLLTLKAVAELGNALYCVFQINKI